MPFHRVPPFNTLDRLFALVKTEDPGLLPVIRWLLLGPRLATLVLPEIPPPSASELLDLLRLLRAREPSLSPVGEELIRSSRHGEEAWLEICVDRLLEHSDWEHPTQVLERPRPDFGKLLQTCLARREASQEDDRLAYVIDRVERAARIADEARQRRRLQHPRK